ncbi:hypothetical protein Daus18300_009684 [Diaporthe australafricana]|uniref:Uncharacterized protein n=1 Tax=Diaporthe australafricana TaxID=127596 RepID=A0ABR3WD94_9PEZI
MASKLTLGGGIALVAGAASGIGKETAFTFAEAGVQGVVFADINDEAAKEAAEESKSYAKNAEYRAISVKLDIAEKDSVQNLVDTAVKEFGRIDYAVNSAGIDLENFGSFTQNVNLDVFDKTTDTIIKGAVLFVGATMRAMAQQEPRKYTGRHGERTLGKGSIVLLGSTNSIAASPGMISYVTAKHGIIGITRGAAVDAIALKNDIRVNTLCPSWVDTPMVQNAKRTNPILGPLIETITPMKRAATPDEVADYTVFLCSPSASYINGTALPIDGGLTLPAPPPLPM